MNWSSMDKGTTDRFKLEALSRKVHPEWSQEQIDRDVYQMLRQQELLKELEKMKEKRK